MAANFHHVNFYIMETKSQLFLSKTPRAPFSKQTPLKIYPSAVQFKDVEENQKYELVVHARNESTETQKIRIINPCTSYFRLSVEANPLSIAPGLASKIVISFYFESLSALSGSECLRDQITILGNNFKTPVALVATLPNYSLRIPKIFNLNTLTRNKEQKYQIPIRNIGKEDVEISSFNCSSPALSIEHQRIVIKKNSLANLNIKARFTKPGPIEEWIQLPNSERVTLKGVCIDEKVQIYDEEGNMMKAHDFKMIYVGEQIKLPFYVVNGSANRVECLAKVFPKTIPDYVEIKVNEEKMAFVSRQNPKTLNDEENRVNSECQFTRFEINSFEDFKNSLTLYKEPTMQDLKVFEEQIFDQSKTHQEKSLHSFAKQERTETLPQVTETLFVKVMKIERPIKVILKYSTSVPKIKVTESRFEFGLLEPKKTKRLNFYVKNELGKEIPVKFSTSSIFVVEGSPTIKPYAREEYEVVFRPIIFGEYSEAIQISIFDIWRAKMKAFGECKPLLKEKTSRKLTGDQSMSSTRYLDQERRKRVDKEHKSLLRAKFSERTQQGFYKMSDLPIDLAFDACENPKVLQIKRFGFKTKNEGLYLNSQLSQRALTNRTGELNHTGRLNIKEVVKFSEELTMRELSKIQVKGDRLDFGSIFIGSESQRQLVVCNKNSKAIIVQLNLNKNECLREVKPEVKKIEPMGEARFCVAFKSEHLGQFRSPVSYIINKQHIFEIDAIAMVTLVNVEFSTRELRFSFSSSDISFERTQSFIVTNQGGVPVKFHIFQPENKCFYIQSKREQELKPKCSTTISIIYRPIETNETGGEKVDQDKIVFKIIGGAENIIRCIGTVAEPKINVKQAEILYPEIFISTETCGKITIRNLSKIESVARLELSSPELAEVFSFPNNMFAIGPEERKEVAFSILSHDVKAVKGHIVLMVRGGKTFKIPVSLNFCFPSVEVLGLDCIELDVIPVFNNRVEKEIMLVNRTKTQIKLEYNAEDMEISGYMIEFITPQDGLELAFSGFESRGQKSLTKTKKMGIYFDDELNESRCVSNKDKVINKIISLAPEVPTKLRLKFIPKEARVYEVRVPLLLHRATREIYPISNLIKCRAVEPQFYIQPYSVDFENVIISDNEFAYKKTIELVNPHNKIVHWEIDPSTINTTFLFAESSGLLQPLEEKKIDVYFRPFSEGKHVQKILVESISGEEGSAEVELRGNAVSPRIAFTSNILILPVVPLDTESKGTVVVENEGFESVSVTKWKIGATFPQVNLSIQFLDGHQLSLAKKKLSIEVTFKSPYPISFTTNLELCGELGEKITIPISATADNCVLTNFSYLESQSSGSIVKDRNDSRLKLQTPQVVSPTARKSKVQTCSSLSGNFIRKWCSYELNLHFESFPSSFMESRGELLYDLVNRMSGGRHSLKKPSIPTDDKKSRVQELYEFYCEAIESLQKEGAFLNHIRPEHLLNASDYLLFGMNSSFTLEEEEFEDISQQSWICLFYQLCKIYVESTVNKKFLGKLMDRKQKNEMLKSTVYSDQQLLILRFLNEFLSEDKFYNFSDHARIFQIIQRIIENTFKVSLIEELSNLKINADSMMLHEFLVVVSKFLHSHLQELGLAMYLESNDLFTMDHKEYILFFISLMNNLVHYQNSAVVEFECAVDEACRKSIELENPSKNKKIRYWVKIYGGDSFVCDIKEIQLDKKEKKMIDLAYHCHRDTDEEARLLLVPIQDEEGFIPAHSLSFLLVNKVIKKNVVKKIKVSTKLYEIKTISIDVDIPEADYTVRLEENEERAKNTYPTFYLVSQPTKVSKISKEKLELKIASLRMGSFKCEVIFTSSQSEEFMYEISLQVDLPNVLQTIKLPALTTEKEEKLKIQIPMENEQLAHCLKFQREFSNKLKKKPTEGLPVRKGTMKKTHKVQCFDINLADESHFSIEQKTLILNPMAPDTNTIAINAFFPKSYRNYSSLLLLQNTDSHDTRVYELVASVSTKPKISKIKISTKVRTPLTYTISNKLWPCFYKPSSNIAGLSFEFVENSPEILMTFAPNWEMKEEMELLVESSENFEQNIYRISFEAIRPDPVPVPDIVASSLFPTDFEIDCRSLQLAQKRVEDIAITASFVRPHTMQLDLTKQKIIGTIEEGEPQSNAIIKLCIKRSQVCYELVVNIKNRQLVNLPSISAEQNIGEVKEFTVPSIKCDSSDFKYVFPQEPYLSYEVVAKKGEKRPPGFYVKFTALKEVSMEKQLIFHSEGRDYLLKALFIARKVDPVFLAAMTTDNLEKRQLSFIVSNVFDSEGKYRVELSPLDKADHTRFKVELAEFHLKSRDKINMMVTFEPAFIGQVCRATLSLKSDSLPELTYILEGESQFKCVRETIDIETKNPASCAQSFNFVNEFEQKDRFRFEILPNDSDYKFDRGGHHFVEEVLPSIPLVVSVVRNESKVLEKRENKIVITKLKERRVVAEYKLHGMMVKSLREEKCHWECKARETIFESISLPAGFALKQIEASPEILKYLSYSSDEQKKNELKLKFTPMKPSKSKTHILTLLTEQVKFTLTCRIRVNEPAFDDSITIRTDEIREIGQVLFKLTNIHREPAPFHAYLENGTPELTVEPDQGTLDPYGKQGTPITIKFCSQTHNKRVEDKLIIETNDMYWMFKVVGHQSKKLQYLK